MLDFWFVNCKNTTFEVILQNGNAPYFLSVGSEKKCTFAKFFYHSHINK